MVVYYDLVFMINLIYEIGIFYMVKNSLYISVSFFRIVCAALIESVLIVLLLPIVWELVGLLIALFMNVIITYCLFKIVSIGQLFKAMMIEFAGCVLFAGVTALMFRFLDNEYMVLVALGSILFGCMYFCELAKSIRRGIRKEHDLRLIEVVHNKTTVLTKCLVDSGNHLIDPISKVPVCIMEKSLSDELLLGNGINTQKGYRMIPYRAVGKTGGVLEAFFVDQAMIFNEKGDKENFCHILCAVSPDNFSKKAGYRLILHPKIYE